jgi:small-conductance mechanosensitive channel
MAVALTLPTFLTLGSGLRIILYVLVKYFVLGIKLLQKWTWKLQLEIYVVMIYNTFLSLESLAEHQRLKCENCVKICFDVSVRNMAW